MSSCSELSYKKGGSPFLIGPIRRQFWRATNGSDEKRLGRTHLHLVYESGGRPV